MTPEEWFSLPAGTLIRGIESVFDEISGYYFLTPSLKKWSLNPNAPMLSGLPSPFYSEGIYFLTEGFETEFNLLTSAEALKSFKNSPFGTRNIVNGCETKDYANTMIWDEVVHIKDADQSKIVGMLLGGHCVGYGSQNSPVICSSILLPSGETWGLMLTTKPNMGKEIVLYY